MRSLESSEPILDQLNKWVARRPRKARGKSASRADKSESKPIQCDVFNLPLDLLFSGVVSSTGAVDTNVGADSLIESATGSTETDPASELAIATQSDSKTQLGLTCLTCKLVFAQRADQLAHFKTNFHRHNLGRKLKGEMPLDQDQFDAAFPANGDQKRLAGDSDEEPNTTSSGESDTSDVDAHDDMQEYDSAPTATATSSAAAAESAHRVYRDGHGEVTKSFHSKTGSLYHFSPSALEGWTLSISNAIFLTNSPLADSRSWSDTDSDLWSHCAQQLSLLRKRPMIAVLILRSGRFSGAIFDNSSKPDTLVAHKVFRRYTVRAKAGGGQSSHDNKGGKAKSMGAQLRRYGEKALEEDVRRQMTLWQDYLENCGLILVATTKTMRPILFEKPEDAGDHVVLLKKGDPRVVSVPFAVDKPTLEAAQRVHHRIITAVLSPPSAAATHDLCTILEEEETEEQEEKEGMVRGTAGNGGAAGMVDSVPRLSSSGAAAEAITPADLPPCPLAAELILTCETLSDAAAAAYVRQQADEWSVAKESRDDANDTDGGHDTAALSSWRMAVSYPNNLADLTTALHVAARRDLVETVEALLLRGANPERQDVRGRTPYHLCTSKETRNVFRRCRATLGEEAWDWSSAGVPEALTDEKLKQQRQKEKDKKKRAQQKKKEQKARDEEALEEALGLKQAEEVAREIERQEEEERLRNLSGYCVFCATSLYKRDYYDVLEHRCCSTECVAKLRRKLAAEAALQRFQK